MKWKAVITSSVGVLPDSNRQHHSVLLSNFCVFRLESKEFFMRKVVPTTRWFKYDRD